MSTAAPEQIAEDILGYLIENASASDTLDGIVRWWLFEQKVRRETEMVRGVVANLVARGLLTERVGADSQKRYRLNPDKAEEARAFLAAARQQE